MAPAKKKYRYSLLAVFCTLLISTSLADASSITDALRKAPIGDLIKAQSLAGSNVETVCALQPYQDRLLADNDVAKGLNARLNAEAFSADEGHFTFVIVRNGDMELEQIKRSVQLDIFGFHQLPAEVMLPGQFVQAQCTDGQSAAIIKILFRGRTYVVFGSLRQ
ncbi:hypothetical protein [Rhizobium ruizarguesonis]|uniref:hypothetical protein n=1 Tax=Rhizobium ruizarguesonis TaxID=2081791 RepID=UPI00103130DE|nr:hypothetical protein [Rhizobium ruizarguesonis]TBA91091.1 hypothetical protein ELH54_15275 [Rhizobium ruizarguesonis]